MDVVGSEYLYYLVQTFLFGKVGEEAVCVFAAVFGAVQRLVCAAVKTDKVYVLRTVIHGKTNGNCWFPAAVPVLDLPQIVLSLFRKIRQARSCLLYRQ